MAYRRQEPEALRLRKVYVGGIPWNWTEKELVPVLSKVGKVEHLSLVRDKETGRSLGYAFCRYVDEMVAAAAIKHLHGFDVGGGARLRVAHPNKDRTSAGGGGGGAGGGQSSKSAAGGMNRYAVVMSGMSEYELWTLMKQTQEFVKNDPDRARALLLESPQLAQALLHGQIRLGMMQARGQAAGASPLPPAPASASSTPTAPDRPMPMDTAPPYSRESTRDPPPPQVSHRDRHDPRDAHRHGLRGPDPRDPRGPPRDPRGHMRGTDHRSVHSGSSGGGPLLPAPPGPPRAAGVASGGGGGGGGGGGSASEEQVRMQLMNMTDEQFQALCSTLADPQRKALQQIRQQLLQQGRMR